MAPAAQAVRRSAGNGLPARANGHSRPRRLHAGPQVGHPSLGPAADGAERLLERAPLLGELVLDADGRFGHDDAGDDLLGLELAEPLGEHPIADVRDGAAKLGKSHAVVQEQTDDGARPAPADQLDGLVELGAEVRPGAHGLDLSRHGLLDTIYLLLYSHTVFVSSTLEDHR